LRAKKTNHHVLIKFHGVFCAILGPGTLDFHKTVLSGGASRDSRRSEKRRNCIHFLTLHMYCPVRGKIGVRDLHIMPLSIYKFRENRLREECTFLKGANETIFS
jgi:hypothetical protein